MPQEFNPSRAEVEAQEVLTSLLQEHPLSEAQPQTEPLQEGIYTLTSSEAQTLNCIAIVRDGQILPMVDLEALPEPRTPGEKMHYLALAARTILDGLMEALLFWEERRRNEAGEEDEGDNEEGTCHV